MKLVDDTFVSTVTGDVVELHGFAWVSAWTQCTLRTYVTPSMHGERTSAVHVCCALM